MKQCWPTSSSMHIGNPLSSNCRLRQEERRIGGDDGSTLLSHRRTTLCHGKSRYPSCGHRIPQSLDRSLFSGQPVLDDSYGFEGAGDALTTVRVQSVSLSFHPPPRALYRLTSETLRCRSNSTRLFCAGNSCSWASTTSK